MSDRQTIFSDDRIYRYTLWREFTTEFIFDCGNRMKDGYVQFIGLNPSTADETKDDPTIRRCIDFTKRWGYGALCMTNLFAYRATDPDDMKRVENPGGQDNRHHLLQISSKAGLVIAAWGKHGKHMHMDLNCRQWLSDINVKLHHLGLNDDGTPKHPLYLKATTTPALWNV